MPIAATEIDFFLGAGTVLRHLDGAHQIFVDLPPTTDVCGCHLQLDGPGMREAIGNSAGAQAVRRHQPAIAEQTQFVSKPP
jgi:hypothetical protein